MRHAVIAAVLGLAMAGESNATDLVRAARAGDTAEVQRLLAEGAEPNAIDDENRHGDTALVAAAREGHIDTAQALIAGGAYPGMSTVWSVTPVRAATEARRKAMVRMLVAAGADPQGEAIITPVTDAALDQDTRRLEALLSAGDDPDEMVWAGHAPVLIAAKKGDIASMAVLLEHGADPNAAAESDERALHLMVGSGSAQGAALLLAHGADPNAATRSGIRALHKTTDEEMIELLLKHGADPRAKDAQGVMALPQSGPGRSPEGQCRGEGDASCWMALEREEECYAWVNQRIHKKLGKYDISTLEVRWSAECVQGGADGVGVLTMHGAIERLGEFEYRMDGRMWKGRPRGYWDEELTVHAGYGVHLREDGTYAAGEREGEWQEELKHGGQHRCDVHYFEGGERTDTRLIRCFAIKRGDRG